LSRSDTHFFLPAIEYIYLFGVNPVKVLYILVIEICVGDGFPVEINEFIGSKQNRCA
jgi:hypothetical protein